LTLIYSTLSLPSWSAGSRQVACSIGATLGNGGWATLLNSAKGALKINGQSPVPPPDIPQERLSLPPIPTGPTGPDTHGGGGASSTGSNGSSNASGSNGTSGGSSSQRQGNQHLPGQAPAPAVPPPAPEAPPPAPEGPPPGGAPPPPPPPAPEPAPPPPPPPPPPAP